MYGKLRGITPDELYRQWRSGHILPAYYFAGDDRLEKGKAREKLLSLLKTDPSSIHRSSGNEVRSGDLVALAETLSLFSGHRLVWVEEAHKIPAAEKKALAEYLDSPNPSTCLVFSSDDWKTDPGDPVIAGVHVLKGLVHFSPPTGDRLSAWIAQTAREQGISVAPEAVERLVSEAGEDREILLQELERLALFCKGKKQALETDVLASLGYTQAHSEKELAYAVACAMAEQTPQARRRALALADRLLEGGEDPSRLYNWVGYAVQHLMAAKRLMASGAPQARLHIQVRAYYNPDLADHARRLNETRLLKALQECAKAEARLKTGAAGTAAPYELKELIVRVTQ